ncbi:hypothetical protein ACJMK2_026295 [Sinanodonta woodiana]|uniref:Uncharacterized protein n=1 Tax=Sinanodonta woodiana TaxID=1069815 RepID=A0ABD3XMV1_SINWO
MSSQLLDSNKAADNLSVTGCIDMSEWSGDAETFIQEDKTADTQSVGIPIVIASGAGNTETSNEGNRKVDNQMLSYVMITSDNAEISTEPSEKVELLLSDSSTATVDGSSNSETVIKFYSQPPDNQQTSLCHHRRGNRRLENV